MSSPQSSLLSIAQFERRDHEYRVPADIRNVDDAYVATVGRLSRGKARAVAPRAVLQRSTENVFDLFLSDAMATDVGLARLSVDEVADPHRSILERNRTVRKPAGRIA